MKKYPEKQVGLEGEDLESGESVRSLLQYLRNEGRGQVQSNGNVGERVVMENFKVYFKN